MEGLFCGDRVIRPDFRNTLTGSINAVLLDLSKGFTFRGGAGQEQALHKKESSSSGRERPTY
jgi:hypothetical protein